MTVNLLEVRQAIKTVLEGVDGLNTVYSYRAASPSPPCATVGWPDLYTPGTYIGGSDAWEAIIPVQVLVSMGMNDAADENLVAFFAASGDSSIFAAFNAGAGNLGGVLTTGFAVVRNVTDIGVAQFSDDGVQYMAATFNIEVNSS